MLTAGTLGTVIGDYASFNSGLGTGYASVLLGGVLAALFFSGRTGPLANLWFYWLTVVAVRAAGTAFGDFLSHNVMSLALSTLVTGVVFVAMLLLWRGGPAYPLSFGGWGWTTGSLPERRRRPSLPRHPLVPARGSGRRRAFHLQLACVKD